MAKMSIRDRDYILDDKNNYLKVVGDFHPNNYIISYVKYFPSKFGTRSINDKPYGYNSSVSKSFAILKDLNDRVTFSNCHGGILTCTPTKDIVKVFSCRDKIKEVFANKDRYNQNRVGEELINFLNYIDGKIDINNLGITGSFLIDSFNEKSDIDLTCYGRETFESLRKVFSSDFIIPYQGQFATQLYTRRMTHMAPMNFDALIKQENRKLQGLTKNNLIHINCQPLKSDDDLFFKNMKFIEVGEISCIVEITDDSNGIFAPAYYEIKVINVIDSFFSGEVDFKNNIRAFISFIGAYSCSFENGDKVYLEGKLIQIKKDKELFYGIELSPWNTDRLFKAALLN